MHGDGRNDLIVGNAHGYGLWWLEQKMTGGQRQWAVHPIDPYNAQYHNMQWTDIDGDGECELITGKRHRAHCGNEAGEWENLGIYYFKWNGESFSKQIIDYDRWLVIEAFSRALPELAAAMRVWRDLFKNADDLYWDGLRFIQEQWNQAGSA